ncbi:MAG TPA: type II toxin-antitoxin system HicA family toxin [Pyrinomonadaceae bacterium]|jgi:predicted RNA binding protein YcfA (HicA-like mRNA interferase family)|nr:type II toxin-antitoxin system HicA family toxin [Pyrinomonadaceae bacterium]
MGEPLKRSVIWSGFPSNAKKPIILTVKVKEVIKLLEQHGWYLARTKGSHRQFKHPVKAGAVTVAGKERLDVPRGTLNSILKQAGLKDREDQE